MARKTVFISYRHGDPSTRIADTLYTALSAVREGMGFELFMDRHSIEPSALVDKTILAGLKRTTHFIALVDNDYWASNYCRLELDHAVDGFEKGRPVRLLFVMAGAIKPEYMMLKKKWGAKKGKNRDSLVSRIGDLQFLGPFNKARRLVRLEYETPSTLADQISGLIDELARVL